MSDMVKVCLGDVAREFREICKEDIAKYPHVGLEHLDSGCIALSKWDSDKETTFTKKFYKGQILFGRRRAYLKKAVVAPFDGICSGDITVFEAIPSRIYPDYLPFIIQNDSFFDYAVGKSTGSLSRRAKWEFLKKYEFDLPSLEEQKRRADLLWAAENQKQKTLSAINHALAFKKSFLHSIIEHDTEEVGIEYYCSLVLDRYKGSETNVTAVDLDCIEPLTGNLLATKNTISSSSGYFEFQKGDTLFGKLRPYLEKYHYAMSDGICCGEIWTIHPTQNARSKFVYLLISSNDFIKVNSSQTDGTKMPRTSWEIASEFKCPRYSLDEQDIIISKVNKIDETITNLKKFNDSLSKLIPNIINESLEGS